MRDTPNNETVIVEYGFVDSTGDDVAFAEAVTKAITEYADSIYIAPSDGETYTVVSGDY